MDNMLYYNAELMGPDSLERTGLTAVQRKERAAFVALFEPGDREYAARQWDAQNARR